MRTIKENFANNTLGKWAISETLKWCNRVRKLNGEPEVTELPKAERQNGRECPCGKLTKLFVCSTFAYSEGSGGRYPVPAGVMAFVVLFDGGYLPDYDINFGKQPTGW